MFVNRFQSMTPWFGVAMAIFAVLVLLHAWWRSRH